MIGSTYDLPTHKRLAEDFNALHENGPIRLANAWDAGTAKLVAQAGATAIATTSGGASWAQGLPDGNSLTRDQALENIASIVASVDLPVTADIETGYGTTLDELTTTIRQVLEAGAVGINIEDSGGNPLYTIDEQAGRIATIRVKRVSLGTGLTQVAFSLAQTAARELFEKGTYTTLDGTIDYFAMNDKLA